MDKNAKPEENHDEPSCKRKRLRTVKMDQKILNQYFANLRSFYDKVHLNHNNKGTDDKGFEEICGKIENLIKEVEVKKEKTWTDAGSIEQFLVQLLDEKDLELLLRNKLQKAKKNLKPDQYNYYENLHKKSKESKESSKEDKWQLQDKRAFLSRLIDDLYWNYTIRNAHKYYARKMLYKINFCIIATLIIASFFAITSFVVVPKIDKLFQNEKNITNKTEGPIEKEINKFLPISSAMMAGLVGACFSMLIGVWRKSLSDLMNQYRFSYIFSRMFFGIGAGSIVLFLFKSGLLQGNMMPNFEKDIIQNGNNWSLLIVWCFIAGFSEKLIPNMLSKTVDQVSLNEKR